MRWWINLSSNDVNSISSRWTNLYFPAVIQRNHWKRNQLYKKEYYEAPVHTHYNLRDSTCDSICPLPHLICGCHRRGPHGPLTSFQIGASSEKLVWLSRRHVKWNSTHSSAWKQRLAAAQQENMWTPQLREERGRSEVGHLSLLPSGSPTTSTHAHLENALLLFFKQTME